MVSKLILKTESEEPTARLAVLIDADNAQPSVFGEILAEIAKFGEATVKRIYGDFTTQQSSSWKKILQQYAIKPVQQFAYTTGKNATDSTMIIDAMDLLYTRRFDGFCLITSDSDFTGLAMRLREEGLSVFGFGESKTPESFRKACHKFILTEVLRPIEPISSDQREQEPKSLKVEKKPELAIDTTVKDTVESIPVQFLLSALDQSSDENGWAQVGTFGSYLGQLQSDFDSRKYGYKKLSDLVKARTDLFQVDERIAANGVNKNLYLKAKK